MIYKKVNLTALHEIALERPLVCIGAGGELHRLVNNCKQTIQFEAIVDDSIEKQGKFFTWGTKLIPIYSLQQIYKRKIKDWLLAVNVHNMIELIKQIYSLPGADTFRVYWTYSFLPNSVYEVKHLIPSSLRLTKTPQIPRILHYAWFGNNAIPQEHQEYIAGWKRLCPDYEIICWNEDNYDVKKNRYMYQAYKEKKWGFVPDYLRKDVIYKYGGIYLDTDVEMIRPLDELLYQYGFCGFEGNRVAFGLGFGAVPGLPIIREMRDAYDNMTFEFLPRDKMSIGPDYETRQLEKHGLRLNGEYQSIAGLTVYPTEVLSGTIPYTGESIVTSVTYTVHHYAGSWDESANRRKRNVIEKLCKMMLTSDSFDMKDFLIEFL